jgi:triosephosphate isomerase
MPQVQIAAQTCSSHQHWAYTGEISATMLASLGVDRVIVWHSERRAYFSEYGNTVTQKIQQAHNAGLWIIYCCGEPDKNNDQTCYITQEIQKELLPIFAELDEDKLLIAYEPRWAIWTWKIPSQQHIEQAFEHIWNTHEKMSDVIFLYGGSVKPQNASTLADYTWVDWFLVGGASLEVERFLEIIG